MPIKIIMVNWGTISRIKKHEKVCRLCKKSLRSLKYGDYVCRKTTKKSALAHTSCGLQYNWISERDLQKLDIPLIPMQK